MLEIYSPTRMCITGMDGSGKSSGEILERAKRVHLHENTADLRSIRNEYNVVLDHFQTHHCVAVVRVDTTTHSKPEVAEKVCATLLQSFGIMT